MKPRYSILLPAAALGLAFTLVAESNSAITQIKKLPAGPAEIVTTLPEGTFYRIEASNDLQTWQALYTLKSTGTGDTFTDTASTGQPRRFFRSIPLEGTNWVTGEHIPTADGDIVIHPIVHASFVMQWNGKIIYCDPAGNSAVPGSASTLYADLPKADLVLYTHAHGDHWNSTSLTNIIKPNGTVAVAPQTVKTAMSDAHKALTTVLATNSRDIPSTTIQAGVNIAAIPAYNNTPATANYHRPNEGFAYVLTMGGKRIYISGDTGDITPMRNLENIDVAFLCMNQPFTMTVTEAASATMAFKPGIVFPYHFRNSDSSLSDLAQYQALVTDDAIDIRVREWY